jgi:AbrB family looped-hinge helix DNA binding protein
METTKLSSKGQVIIPKAFRSTHHWEPGLELMVIDTGDGLLLKPKATFAPSDLSEVFGMFKDKVCPEDGRGNCGSIGSRHAE